MLETRANVRIGVVLLWVQPMSKARSDLRVGTVILTWRFSSVFVQLLALGHSKV